MRSSETEGLFVMTFCFLRPLMIGHGHLADLWSSVDGHMFLVTNTLFAAVIGSFLNDACHVELHDCSEERHELVIVKKFSSFFNPVC